MSRFTLDPQQAPDHMFVTPGSDKKPTPTSQEHWLTRTQAIFDRQRASRRARRVAFFATRPTS